MEEEEEAGKCYPMQKVRKVHGISSWSLSVVGSCFTKRALAAAPESSEGYSSPKNSSACPFCEKAPAYRIRIGQ